MQKRTIIHITGSGQKKCTKISPVLNSVDIIYHAFLLHDNTVVAGVRLLYSVVFVDLELTSVRFHLLCVPEGNPVDTSIFAIYVETCDIIKAPKILRTKVYFRKGNVLCK